MSGCDATSSIKHVLKLPEQQRTIALPMALGQGCTNTPAGWKQTKTTPFSFPCQVRHAPVSRLVKFVSSSKFLHKQINKKSSVKFLLSIFHEIHVLSNLSNLTEICSLTSLRMYKKAAKNMCLFINKPWCDCLWVLFFFSISISSKLSKKISEQRLFQITLLGGVQEQCASLTCPGVRNACDFWEFNLVLEFVVACCSPNVQLVM